MDTQRIRERKPLRKSINGRDSLGSMTKNLAINIRYQYLRKIMKKMRREIKNSVKLCSRIFGEEKNLVFKMKNSLHGLKLRTSAPQQNT